MKLSLKKYLANKEKYDKPFIDQIKKQALIRKLKGAQCDKCQYLDGYTVDAKAKCIVYSPAGGNQNHFPCPYFMDINDNG